MNDTQIRDALLQVEERPVPSELTDRVFLAMAAELEAEVAKPIVVTHRRRLPRLEWVRPGRLVLAAAGVVALIVGAVVLLSVPKPPSALAMLQDARESFERLPAYHARTAVAANENADDPDLETTWETEDWYQDSRHWRTTFGSSTTPMAGTGDVWVMSPDLFAEYDASTDVFAVRPSAEVSGPMQDPSFFFDPSLQWWGTGAAGEGAKPSDRFFEENCTATEGELIGRQATKLVCEAKPRDLELWLDDETGMLLRISTFDIVREITSIEFEPELPAGVFEITPPEGAKVRWRGSGEPPPEYAVPIGTEVAARHQLVDGPTDGLTVVELTAKDLWVLVTRCDRPSGMACGTELRRVDARTGGVLATLMPPEGFGFGDVSAADEGVWVQLASVSPETPATAYVQRIDPERNVLVGQRIETGSDSGGLAQLDGSLWSASGRHREVKLGRAESFYHSLARIDLETDDVTQFDLDADVMGVQAVGGSLWVTTSAIDERDPERSVYELVEFDPSRQQLERRVVIPGWPNSTTSDGDRLYTLFADEGMQWHLGVVDIATGALTTAPIGPPGADVSGMAVAAGHAWIGSFSDDAVLKVDLSSLQVAGSVATGRQPASVRFGNGSIWITHPAEGTLVRIDVE